MTLKLSDLPDVSFAEKDINKILSDMISGYEQAYFEQTGERKVLRPGDPIRIWIYSQALRELQLRHLIDDAAKQNLLKYARSANLENLGAFSKTERLEAKAATVTMRFNLSAPRATDETIEAGTRVSPGGEIYFSVKEDTVVPAGDTSVDIVCECTQKGEIGNGFTTGQINILVDPIPWIDSVENTDESQGGTDEEDDDSFRERIHLAPEGYSVAGPSGAYEHFVREYSTQIEDVRIDSPSAGVVDIRVLLADGTLPDQAFLDGLSEHLNDREKRPLTDNVQVAAPTEITYNIDVTYYISSDDAAIESDLRSKIEAAINEYEIWQRSKIGRDINPDELVFRARQAGAKRVVVTAPVFTTVGITDVATAGTKTVNYGGLEDE